MKQIKNKCLGALALYALLFIGCMTSSLLIAQDCPIDVTITPSTTQVIAYGGTVAFDCTATGGDSSSYTYNWQFGYTASPSSSSDQTPGAVTFSGSTSSQTVTITVTDSHGNTGSASVKVVTPQIKTPYPTDTQDVWYLGGVYSDGANFQSTATFASTGVSLTDDVVLDWKITNGTGNATVATSTDTLSGTITSQGPSSELWDTTVAIEYEGVVLDSANFTVYSPSYCDETFIQTNTTTYTEAGIVIGKEYDSLWTGQLFDNTGDCSSVVNMHINESFSDENKVYTGTNWNMGSPGSWQIDNSGGYFTDGYDSGDITTAGGIPQVVFQPAPASANQVITFSQTYGGGSSSTGAGQPFETHNVGLCQGEGVQY